MFLKVLYRLTVEDPTFFGVENVLIERGGMLRYFMAGPNNLNYNVATLLLKISSDADSSKAEYECSGVESETAIIQTEQQVISQNMYYYEEDSEDTFQVRNAIKKYACVVSNSIPNGIYNLSVVHSQFGLVKIANYTWTSTIDIFGSYPTFRQYNLRVVSRVKQIIQGTIGPLGGFIELLGDFDLTSQYKISFLGTSCHLVESLEGYKKCFIGKVSETPDRMYFKGNQGVTIFEKPCSLSDFNLLRDHSDALSNGYTSRRVERIFESENKSDGLCARYISALNIPQTTRISFGAACAPEYCRVNISEAGKGYKQNITHRFFEIENSQKITLQSSFFLNSPKYMSQEYFSFDKNIDYLIDFQRLKAGYINSTFGFMPMKLPENDYRGPQLTNTLGFHTIYKLGLTCSYGLENPKKTFITSNIDKIKFKVTIEINAFKGNPPVSYFKMTPPQITIPDDCSGYITKSPFHNYFFEQVGYHGAYCNISYLNNANLEKDNLYFTHPETEKILIEFVLPLFQYGSIKENLSWNIVASSKDRTLSEYIVSGAYIKDSSGSLPFNGWLYFKSKLTSEDYNVSISSTPKISSTQIENMIKQETSSDVKTSVVFIPKVGFELYFHMKEPGPGPIFELTQTSLQGCQIKVGDSYLGRNEASFSQIVQGSRAAQFRTPPPELFRTIHNTPQILIEDDSSLMICDNCNLSILPITSLAKVNDVLFDFQACRINISLINTLALLEPSIQNFTVRLLNLQNLETFANASIELKSISFEQTKNIASSEYILSIDLENLMKSNPEKSFLNGTNKDNLKIEYLGHGIFENEFAEVITSELTVEKLNPTYSTLDIITFSFTAKKLTDKTPLDPSQFMSEFDVSFLVYKLDDQGGVVEDLSSRASSPNFKDSQTLFTKIPVLEFDIPNKYKIVLIVNKTDSECFYYSESKIVNLIHDIESFKIEMQSQTFIKEPLKFRLVAFSSVPPAYLVSRLEITLCSPTIIANRRGENLLCELIEVNDQGVDAINPLNIDFPVSVDPNNLEYVILQNDFLKLPGNYTLRVKGILKSKLNQGSITYEANEDFEVLDTNTKIDFSIESREFQQKFFIDQAIECIAAVRITSKSLSGIDNSITLSFDPHENMNIFPDLSFVFKSISWSLSYTRNQAGLLSLDRYVDHCNLVPSLSCIINPHSLPLLTYDKCLQFSISATMRVEKFNSTITGEAKYQFLVCPHTEFFALMNTFHTRYNSFGDLKFDAAMSFDPNLPAQEFFQRSKSTDDNGLLFEWYLDGVKMPQTTPRLSIESFSFINGNSYTLKLVVIGKNRIQRAFEQKFTWSDQNLLYHELFIEGSTRRGTGPLIIPSISFSKSNLTSVFSSNKVISSEVEEFIVDAGKSYSGHTMEMSSAINSSNDIARNYFIKVKSVVTASGTVQSEIYETIVPIKSFNSTYIEIIATELKEEFTTIFKIRIVSNFEMLFFENLDFHIGYKSMKNNQEYILQTSKAPTFLEAVLPYGSGQFFIDTYEHGIFSSRIYSRIVEVKRKLTGEIELQIMNLVSGERNELEKLAYLRMIRDFHSMYLGDIIDNAIILTIRGIKPNYINPNILSSIFDLLNNDLLLREKNKGKIDSQILSKLEDWVSYFLSETGDWRVLSNRVNSETARKFISSLFTIYDNLTENKKLNIGIRNQAFSLAIGFSPFTVANEFFYSGKRSSFRYNPFDYLSIEDPVSLELQIGEHNSIKINYPSKETIIANILKDQGVGNLFDVGITRLVYMAKAITSPIHSYVMDGIILSSIVKATVLFPEKKLAIGDAVMSGTVTIDFRISNGEIFSRIQSLGNSALQVVYRCGSLDILTYKWIFDICKLSPLTYSATTTTFTCKCTAPALNPVPLNYAVLMLPSLSYLSSSLISSERAPVASPPFQGLSSSSYKETSLSKYTSSFILSLFLSLVLSLLLDIYLRRMSRRRSITNRLLATVAFFQSVAVAEHFERVYDDSEVDTIVDGQAKERFRRALDAQSKLEWINRFFNIRQKFKDRFNKGKKQTQGPELPGPAAGKQEKNPLKEEEEERRGDEEENEMLVEMEEQLDEKQALENGQEECPFDEPNDFVKFEDDIFDQKQQKKERKDQIKRIMDKLVNFDRITRMEYLLMRSSSDSMTNIKNFVGPIISLFFMAIMHSNTILGLFLEYTATSARSYRLTFFFLRAMLFFEAIALLDNMYNLVSLTWELYLFYYSIVLIAVRIIVTLYKSILDCFRIFDNDVDSKAPQLKCKWLLGEFGRSILVIIPCVVIYSHLGISQLNVNPESRQARILLHTGVVLMDLTILDFLWGILQLIIINYVLGSKSSLRLKKILLWLVNSQVILMMVEYMSSKVNIPLDEEER